MVTQVLVLQSCDFPGGLKAFAPFFFFFFCNAIRADMDMVEEIQKTLRSYWSNHSIALGYLVLTRGSHEWGEDPSSMLARQL